MKPITRLERFLAYIANDPDKAGIDMPITRIETYLAKIAGADVEIPEPITRIEKYLAKAAGADVAVPEKPITRIQTYLAKWAGQEVEIPSPVTRIEWYLYQLTNAAWHTVTGAIASFITQRSAPLRSLICTINPVQDLHGYDSPWPAGGGKNLCSLETCTITFSGRYNIDAISATGQKFVVSGHVETTDTEANTCLFRLMDSNNNVLASSQVQRGAFSFETVALNSDIAKIDVFASDSASHGRQATATYTKLMICLYPVSDPTFAPYSNLCPISGHTGVDVYVKAEYDPQAEPTIPITFGALGKNLFNKNAVTNGKYLDTTTGLPVNAVGYCVSDFIPVKENETVYIPATNSVRRWFYNAEKTPTTYLSNSGNQAYTPTEDGFIRVSIQTSEIDLDTYQIEKGSSATTYEPYNDTVYGGTLDVVSGQCRKTLAPLLFDDSAWWFSSGFFYKSFPSIQGVCVSEYYLTENGVKMHLNSNNGQIRIYLVDNAFLTQDTDVGALLNGYKLLYELATPITYQLTPQEVDTLVGQNNVWNTAGDTTVEYLAN